MNSDSLFHLSESLLEVAYCCRFTLLSGEVVGLTDRDSDITIGDTVYSSNPGINVSIIHNGQNSGSAEIETIVEADVLDNKEQFSSPYSMAQIEVLAVNYSNVLAGCMPIFKGIVHKTIHRGNRLSMYARKEVAYKLSEKVCKVFSPQCRAQFCDKHCKLDNAQFTSHGSVEKVLDEHRAFEDGMLIATDNYYVYGIVNFLTGKNKNLSLKICSHIGHLITLESRTPYPITTGASYSIIAGCDKSFRTCEKKFKNTANFRGEPHIPDINSIYVPSD